MIDCFKLELQNATQDEDGFLMHSDIPEFSASDEVIAAEGTKASSAADSAAALGQSASFKTLD